jgi:phenylalanyl-tRNA synthetase alpha subunit
MTKKLEELFELSQTDPNDLTIPLPDRTQEITENALTSLGKIESALPTVKGLDAADNEMDALAEMATSSYKDLMDLGMQVEARFSSEIFNSASSMLGHAISAKSAKLDKKLKMIDLQLKKQKIDQELSPEDQSVNIQGDGVIIADRNSLIEQLKKMK